MKGFDEDMQMELMILEGKLQEETLMLKNCRQILGVHFGQGLFSYLHMILYKLEFSVFSVQVKSNLASMVLIPL